MTEEKVKNVKKVSAISFSFNLLLLVIKMIFGLISSSQSLIADAVNSAGDIVASLVSIIGIKVASKPGDKEHPYGHGKAEYIFAALVGISMIIASITMIKNAILSMMSNSTVNVSIFLILVCVVTILVKFSLMIYSKSQYKKTDSILIRCNMEDHRNDMFVTFGVLIGIICSKFGFYFVDGIIGILISIWIVIVAIKIIYPACLVLIDTQSNFIDEAKREVQNFKETKSIDKFYISPVGDKYLAIIEISMDKEKSLSEVHEYIDKIEKKLYEKFKSIIDINIHVNPK
ncbi:cation diffusion facilitator family transporter [Clostridium sp. CAG:1219]|nr:cation diffusion facilitator family transporter [Clostridium sp. CAG:1219]